MTPAKSVRILSCFGSFPSRVTCSLRIEAGRKTGRQAGSHTSEKVVRTLCDFIPERRRRRRRRLACAKKAAAKPSLTRSAPRYSIRTSSTLQLKPVPRRQLKTFCTSLQDQTRRIPFISYTPVLSCLRLSAHTPSQTVTRPPLSLHFDPNPARNRSTESGSHEHRQVHHNLSTKLSCCADPTPTFLGFISTTALISGPAFNRGPSSFS